MINKSYKVPSAFEIHRLLNYLYNNLNVKESILATDRDQADPADHLALAIEVKNDKEESDYFVLDNEITLLTAFN